MKKNSLLKCIGIGFLIFVILTWLITPGTFQNGSFTASSNLEPIGLMSLVKQPLATLGNYSVFGIYILVIAGFYGVLEGIGAYNNFVELIVKSNKKDRNKFMIISVSTFAILSALTSVQYVLFILVPFFVHVMLKLGFNKFSTFLATFGSIIIGNIGAVYGFNISGYLNYYLNISINNNLVGKLILLGLLIILVVFYIMKNDKESVVKKDKLEEPKKEAKKVVTKTTKKAPTKKKSTAKTKSALMKDDVIVAKKGTNPVPFIVVTLMLVVFLLVAGYNWSYGLGFTGFEDLYTKINEVVTKGGFAWLMAIIGKISPIGYWSIEESIFFLLIATLLVSWLYNIKFSKVKELFVNNSKKYLKVAVVITIANIIIYSVLGTSSGANIFYTISNYILGLSKTFNIFVVSLFSFVSGLFLNDFTYFVGYMAEPLKAIYTDSAVYPILAMIMQTMHGLVMLLVPTSLVLVAGLAALDISYKEYIKYIWKLLIQILVVVALVVIALIMFL